MNTPYDRILSGNRRLPGESLQETAVRIQKLADTPQRPMPVTPIEDRDPDAPPGWYDDVPDMGALWG